MAGSDYMWRFLGTVWDGLPPQERNRFSELWRGQEQVFADVLQRFFELDQTLNINNTPVYMTSRWNKYIFNAENEVIEPATFRSFKDLSLGVNLTDFYLIKIAIDDQAPVVVDCRGLIPEATQISEIVFKINQAVGFPLCDTIFEGTILRFTTQSTGPSAKIQILDPEDIRDATEIVLGLTPIELPYTTPRLPYKYSLDDPKVSKIPALQNSIRNENLNYYIIEDADFEIDTTRAVISFIEEPPTVLWAKVTYLQEEVPYYNFGYLIDYRDPSITPEDYLQNLQGLWFAFWQGPRPDYIKRALYLLFSLPVAIENGVVLRIVGDDNDIMEILHSDGQARAYALPSQLQWQVGVGDFVERFQPLVDGIDVFDKTNLPGFIRTELGRDALEIFALPEATRGTGSDTDETKALSALEEHTFLPQINVNAFVRPNINIGSILTFIRNIKPLHKAFYFQIIVAVFNETLRFQERFGLDYDFEVTPNLEINQANSSPPSVREDYEDNDIPALDLDSEDIYFFERGSLIFEDITGPLPQYDVVFD
jgi:hypothetical protein